MPYKNNIIQFMKMKASFLPNDARDIYFTETDEQTILNNQTTMQSKIVCDTMNMHMTNDINNDQKLCPYCVKVDGHCNKCDYFKIHGVCYNGHSDYAKIVSLLHDKNPNGYGIMDYIIKTHGEKVIFILKTIIS